MHINIEVNDEIAKQWRDYKHDHPQFKVKDWFEQILKQLLEKN